jgi:hypothetical protein
LGAFFAAMPQKTGLSASIFWLRQKDFRYNAPEDGRFPRGMDCSGRYRAPGIPGAAAAQNKALKLPTAIPGQLIAFSN